MLNSSKAGDLVVDLFGGERRLLRGTETVRLSCPARTRRNEMLPG
jgi:hypothetical protein